MKTLSILIVEPSAELRRPLAQALSAEGYEVVAMGDGDEAVEVIRQSAFDVVLTSQDTGGMNGLMLAMLAKQLRPEIRVVLLGGFAELPFIDVLARLPLTLDELEDAIKTALSRPPVRWYR